MSNPAALLAAAQAVLPDKRIEAAGVFAPTDDYLAITAAGAAAGALTPNDAPAWVDGLAGAAAIRVSREAVAASRHLTSRLLVAVSEEDIFVLDWDGTKASEILVDFKRARTNVTVSKFGASRRVHLMDTQSGGQLEITGSTGFLSSESAADKLVLALLA